MTDSPATSSSSSASHRLSSHLKEMFTETPLPLITAADVTDAQRQAQSSAKLLLVYLHSDVHPHSSQFLHTSFGDLEVRRSVVEQFLIWAADVADPCGHDTVMKLGVTTFPYVAVCAKRQFIMDAQGKALLRPATLLRELRIAADNGAPTMAKEVAFVREREQREALRRRQQAEYDEAVRKDLEAATRRKEQEALKAKQKQEEEEARRKAEEERLALEAQLAREAAEKAELEHRIEQEKALALSALPPPVESGPDAAHLRFMMPRGDPVEYVFSLDAPVALLYTFVKARPDYNGTPFELFTIRPTREVIPDCPETPIRTNRRLYPRAQVGVREL